eukprot:gene30309-37517_t
MGADNLADFHRWQRWQKIAMTFPIAVIDRPGSTLAFLSSRMAKTFDYARFDEDDAPLLARAPAPAWTFIHGPRSSLSSTAIRNGAKKDALAPSTAEMNGATSVSLALQTVLASLDDSKAEKIVPIDLRGKSVIGDHMVIASGRSHRHVTAVADQLLRALKESGHGNNAKVEGLSSGDWVLIDT